MVPVSPNQQACHPSGRLLFSFGALFARVLHRIRATESVQALIELLLQVVALLLGTGCRGRGGGLLRRFALDSRWQCRRRRTLRGWLGLLGFGHCRKNQTARVGECFNQQ